ncbi:uncharacterized protein LOC117514606 [Thalassophryne amazonica]|uniref:uncharacterized protein LOC117514606 n=1 Tax=Thalassophryne amazonica TaxID=390379 RepID=UPI001471B195|nr:uncharacterized protein LOC117514606 [Thalassophryne amazonica]
MALLFPSCEELCELAKVVLKKTMLSPMLEELDTETLLAMVKKEGIQGALEEKRVVLAQMEATVTNKKKQQAKERGQQEKQIHSKQLKIKVMMSNLSNLTSELSKVEEAHKALLMQMNKQEIPETRAEVEENDTPNKVQAANSKVKPQGKGRKQVVKSSEPLQDSTKQSKPTKKTTRVKDADKQGIQKDDAPQTLKRSTKAPEECTQKSSNQSKPTRTLRFRDVDKQTSLTTADTSQNLKASTKGRKNQAEDGAQKHSKSTKTTLESKPVGGLVRKPPVNALTTMPKYTNSDSKINAGQKALRARRPPGNSLTSAPKFRSGGRDKINNGQQGLRARKPSADSQITAPQLKQGSMENAQKAQTSQQVPAVRSRRKAGEEVQPVVLRRSKRSIRK